MAHLSLAWVAFWSAGFLTETAVQEHLYDPIYKGCTSPSTLGGVPLLPFILVTLIAAQMGILCFVFIGIPSVVVVLILYVFLIGWARRVSRNDEQRLLQLMMKMRMRGPQLNSRRFWGAVSFSPLPPRK